MTTLLTAPYVELSWVPTGLTIYFQEYRVWSRPTRTPVQDWKLRARYDVPAGYTATVVEARHTKFRDFMAGWSITGGEYEAGNDYLVTVMDITGAESPVAASNVTARGIQVPYPGNPWLTCNSLPVLNCPVEILQGEENTLTPRVAVREYAGRDHFVTISGKESPGRALTANAQFFEPVGAYQVNPLRLAAKSGLEVALLKRLGERVVGTIQVTNFAPLRTAREGVGFTVYETDDSSVANYNLPCGLRLDGSNDYVTTPDNVWLDPASSAFSVVMAAKFSTTASKYALSKGNLGTSDGYGFRTTGNANELQFFIDGATTSGGPVITSTDWFSDVAVAVGTSSGTAQNLYLNGTAGTPTSVTHGAVANSTALVAGANNAGGSGWMLLDPLRAYALYMRVLTPTEVLNATRYLQGIPGYRMPAGAVLMVDLRDDRTWKGSGTTLHDLSDYGNSVTTSGSPATVGIPWPLSRYETL